MDKKIEPVPATNQAGEVDASYRHLIDWIVEAREIDQPVYISIGRDGAWHVGTEEKLRRRIANDTTASLLAALKPLAISVLADESTASGWRFGYEVTSEQKKAAHLAYFGKPTTLAALATHPATSQEAPCVDPRGAQCGVCGDWFQHTSAGYCATCIRSFKVPDHALAQVKAS